MRIKYSQKYFEKLKLLCCKTFHLKLVEGARISTTDACRPHKLRLFLYTVRTVAILKGTVIYIHISFNTRKILIVPSFVGSIFRLALYTVRVYIIDGINTMYSNQVKGSVI